MTPEERAQYIVRNKAELIEKLDSLQRSWLECSIEIQIELAEDAARTEAVELAAQLCEARAAGVQDAIDEGGSTPALAEMVSQFSTLAESIRATAQPSESVPTNTGS